MLRAGSGNLRDTVTHFSLPFQLMGGQPSFTASTLGLKHGNLCQGLPNLLLSA